MCLYRGLTHFTAVYYAEEMQMVCIYGFELSLFKSDKLTIKNITEQELVSLKALYALTSGVWSLWAKHHFDDTC